VVRFLDRIRAAWRFSRVMRWEECAQWEQDDALAFHSFLKTRSGAKLKLVLRDVCIAQNAAALSKRENLQFEAGFAMGQAALVTLLETLATADDISDTRSELGSGAGSIQ